MKSSYADVSSQTFPSSLYYNTLAAGTPTNVSAEMINTSTIRVSWSPPTDGDNVTGYILYHNDRDGENIETKLSPNEQSYIIDHCGENVNISIIALSPFLASVPEMIELLLRK